MSFLDKAKTQANNIINSNKGGTPMGNPFVKQNTVNTQSPSVVSAVPAVKPTAPGIPGAKPIVPGAKPAIPGIKPTVPGAKPAVPGIKPGVLTPMPITKNEDVTPVEVKAPGIEPVAPKANLFKTTAPTAPTAPVEETKVEDVAPVEEAKVEDVEENKETTVSAEEKKAPTKKKGSSRKKTTSKTEDVKDAPDNTTTEVAEVVIPKTDMSYADACQSVRSDLGDAEWDAQVEYFEEKSRNILISNDMNKAQLHDLLAQVTNLRDEMYSAFVSTKTLYEHLTDKENGKIEVTKRLHGRGSNPEERKLNATIAVMNFKAETGDNINLYELLAETRIRYNFLKGLNDTIEFKKAVLLTMLSSLKSN